ncbi:MAG: hypothetical protein ACRD15_19815, partial [Vicinamibacterales bacterium]
DNLSDRVAHEYAVINSLLDTLQKRPIRYWNYVPGIVDPVGAGLDRYMAFNRGRYAAFAASPDVANGGEASVPTASAIGIGGQDLVIECVASTSGGLAIENPRQVASWRYSRRYGPRPPLFARGTQTILDGHPVLLLGGTASIVGEESRHPGNLEAQVTEVLINMEALIASAGVCARGALERLTDVRIYVVNADDAELVEAAILSRVGRRIRAESAVSRVCRPELLVEVEGVARLPGDRTTRPDAGM